MNTVERAGSRPGAGAQDPAVVDLEDPADHELLFRLGLTRERLFDALGAEW
jgi:hypothetical protein